jgi:hypothetical protein
MLQCNPSLWATMWSATKVSMSLAKQNNSGNVSFRERSLYQTPCQNLIWAPLPTLILTKLEKAFQPPLICFQILTSYGLITKNMSDCRLCSKKIVFQKNRFICLCIIWGTRNPTIWKVPHTMIYIVRDFSKINLWGPCVFAAYGFKTAFARGNDNLWILRHAKKINFFFVKKICHTIPS